MEIIVVFALGAGMFSIAMMLISRSISKRNQHWQQLASDLGLMFSPGDFTHYPQLNGKLDGIRIHATILQEGSGKNARYFASVTAEVSGRLPAGLHLAPEGVFQRLGKLFGVQDIQVGDAELDAHFIIKGADAHGITEILHEPQVRRALLVTQQHCRSLRVEGNLVAIKEPGRNPPPDKLATYIRLGADVATALHQASAQMYRRAEQTAPGAARHAAEREPASDGQASSDPNDWW